MYKYYNLSNNDLKIILNFDYYFYIKYYTDLKSLNKKSAINHYIKHGRDEKRIFSDINHKFDIEKYKNDNNLSEQNNNNYEIWQHFLYNLPIKIQQDECKIDIRLVENKMIYFIPNEYKNYNSDLSHLNELQLYEHYYNHGYNEKRIYCNIVKEFNWLFYYICYLDLKFTLLEDLWRHYIYYGIEEFRNINIDTILKYSISKSILNFTFTGKLVGDTLNYVNNLQELEKKNNSLRQLENNNNNNLSAIIYVYYNRPGELKNETNLAFFIRQTVLKDTKNIYLIILNSVCEIIFPQQQNLIVLHNKNCYDFESYGIGIRHLKTHFNYNSISRLVFMNCSVCGPFVDNWLQVFENKLIQTGSTLCSTVMYMLNGNTPATPGYFNYMINDKNLINMLLQKVFIKHHDKEACITNGEYGLARLLLENRYKITSLIYNYNSKMIYGWRVDRDNNLDQFSLNDLVFVKNVWRAVDGKKRDSIPIKFNEVNSFINNKCNFTYNSLNNINYNLLQIENSAICNLTNNVWHSKSEFYNRYGKNEEFIVFPNNNHNNKLALYAHSDKDNLFRDYCVQAVNTMSQLGYDIIILTTCSTFINVTIPYRRIIYNNYKTDLHMYQTFLNNNFNEIHKYNKVALINDSIILPIHGINNMRNTIKMMENYDLWGIWNSPEMKEHIISSFLHFDKKTIVDLKLYLNLFNLDGCATTGNNNIVQICEIGILEHFKTKYYCKTIIDYKKLNNISNKICPIMHPYIFPQWINNKNIFAIKWKYIGNYLNKNKYNMPYMNYLLRFIHFNHTGAKGHPELQKVWDSPNKYIN